MSTERATVQRLIDRAELVALDDYLGGEQAAFLPDEHEHDETPRWPAPLDLRALLASPAEPPRMVIADWWPRGYATMTAGHGGVGKSNIALQLAVRTALGGEFFGMRCEQLPVLYLMCEDRKDVAHWRLQRDCEHAGISPASLDALHIVDLVGHDAILWRRNPATGAACETPAYAELERLIAKTGAKALFVDGVSDTYGGNENDRAEVKAYINALVRLVGDDGAVMLIHHVSKPTAAAGTTTEGYSGSTGWHNSVRARWYLHPEVEHTDDGVSATGALVLALQKSNLGRSDQTIKLRWDDDAHLFVAEGGISRFDRAVQDTAEQRGIVDAMREVIASGDHVPAAMQGPRTAFHVLSACNAFPATLKNRSGKRRFWRHVEALRRSHTLREQQMRRANRHDVAILVLEAAP